jgi:RNA polymerase sigma factor (sigma-70 family)
MPGPGETADEFVSLYELHYARLVRSLEIAGLRRPVAEDVAQEAFARTLGHWRRVRRGTNPPGYVYRVAFRLARRKDRELSLDDGEPPARSTMMGHSVDDRDPVAVVTLRSAALTVIEAMPSARRSCAVLCLVVELSTKDAAKALGIAESTVRKQVERARADLREALEA